MVTQSSSCSKSGLRGLLILLTFPIGAQLPNRFDPQRTGTSRKEHNATGVTIRIGNALNCASCFVHGASGCKHVIHDQEILTILGDVRCEGVCKGGAAPWNAIHTMKGIALGYESGHRGPVYSGQSVTFDLE